MDLNDVRSAVTLLGLGLFLALMAWTWRPARKHDHEAAAQLPFDGETDDHRGATQ
jgi:cbb3-type cytochrome oxidase subunit 3